MAFAGHFFLLIKALIIFAIDAFQLFSPLLPRDAPAEVFVPTRIAIEKPPVAAIVFAL
jgi:hypothetical protein